MLRALVLLLITALALPALAASPAYHLELEANAAAPFPFLSRFGKVELHVYDTGLRADTLWLDGFSRTGSSSVTVLNPFGRMYTEIPISEIERILSKLSTGFIYRDQVPAKNVPVLKGKVGTVDATRYRLYFGEPFVDLWTTTAIPENPQLRQIVTGFIAGISPGTARAVRRIPGVPIHVELNFPRFQKVTILRFRNLTTGQSAPADALEVGSIYFKAPVLDALWK